MNNLFINLQNSRVSCDRKRCSHAVCQQQLRITSRRKFYDKHSFDHESIPIVDECCLYHCKRSRRHNRKMQLQDQENSYKLHFSRKHLASSMMS